MKKVFEVYFSELQADMVSNGFFIRLMGKL